MSLDTPHSYLSDAEMVQAQHGSGFLEGWLSTAATGAAWRVGTGKHWRWKSLTLIDDLDTNQICRAYVLYLGNHPELLNEDATSTVMGAVIQQHLGHFRELDPEP